MAFRLSTLKRSSAAAEIKTVKGNYLLKLGIFVTHPIQYFTPLWRGLASYPELDVRVHYFSDQGISSKIDPGFGKTFAWDVPLLEGYPFTFLSRRPIGQAAFFRIPDSVEFFRKSRFDAVLIHGYTHWYSLQNIMNAERFGFKVVLRGEFAEFRPGRPAWKKVLREAYLRWFYRKVHHFCPIGKDAIEHLKQYGVSAERMTLSPYSVDDQFLENQKQQFNRGECRKRLGIREDQIVFLFSGKMIERKQPLLLAEAALKIRSDSRSVFIFLGDGDQYEALCNTLKPALKERFIAPGFVNQSELGRYFCASDVFILPSNYDTWGLVVNEAMHFGLPCIVSNRAGCHRDLVLADKTGYIFSFEDVAALAAAMKVFLDHPHKAMLMGQSACAHIQNYTTAKAAEGIRQAVLKAKTI
jgi:glycosyltransferase involved in cell wall biosynthesis